MKRVNQNLFLIPIISFLFIVGVVYIGIDVRLKLKEIETRAQVLDGLNIIQKDLNLFLEDVTYVRSIQTEKHLLFLKGKMGSKLMDDEEVVELINFFSTMESHTQHRHAPKILTKIFALIDFQRNRLNSLSQELKIRWIAVFLLGLLGCLFAIAGSILFLLFAKRTKNLALAENDRIIALEKAEQANKIKYEFLTIVSHELKTYLNAITGLTNLIQERNDNKELDGDLEMLRLSNQGLKNIIDNSIDLGDIEMGEVELNIQPIKLSKYLKGVVHSFIPSAQQNNVELRFEYDEGIPNEVLGDPYRLNQILFNLIKNAVKFGENGLVTISAKLVSRMASEVCIRFSIIDNGIGISAGETDRIFNSFSHANEGITEKYGGSGIGLSIIRNLLLLMKSEIKLKSNPGQGSIFYFELNMGVAKSMTQPENTANGSILIVDDNKINRVILSRYLSVLNISVDEAKSGAEAIEACKKYDYNIVFMDLQMPDVDGIETTKTIRANSPNSKTAIFAVSASSKEVMRKKCKEVEFTGFIPKPIDREDLIRTVNQYC